MHTTTTQQGFFPDRQLIRRRIELLYTSANILIPEIYPDFLCIGAPRSGTTWLHRSLQNHPGIFMPRIRKELHFFDEPVYIRLQDELQDINALPHRKYFDMEKPSHWRWYYRHFIHGKGKIRGEVTPAYSRITEKRIHLIADRMRDVKIIYLLRNPIERAWSGVRNFAPAAKQKQAGEMSASELLEFTMHPRRLLGGDYRSVITRWEKYIDKSRILYLFYEDLEKDPYALARKVCRFLDADPDLLKDPQGIAARVNAADDPCKMPATIYEALREYYRDQVPFLQERFDRDFSDWLTMPG